MGGGGPTMIQWALNADNKYWTRMLQFQVGKNELFSYLICGPCLYMILTLLLMKPLSSSWIDFHVHSVPLILGVYSLSNWISLGG